MKKVIFINSHPIQYFAPLYKYLNEHGVETQAWYGSDESIKGTMDKQFGTQVKWDIPLLKGYESHFFKNYSWKPSLFNGFFGLINLGMIRKIFSTPKSVIVVHGWHYFSHLFILLLGKIRGHVICLRCEMPQNQEMMKRGLKQRIKRFGLKYILFPRVSYFLNIGTQNRLFYKSLGISDKRLVFCPYSVDNDRFRAEHRSLNGKIDQIKERLGIGANDKIVLYSGKYISKKRPLDLVKAFLELGHNDCWLIMVGEGELRSEIESLSKASNNNRIILTGFVNQSQISEYYALADVFVMCSSIGETWGLSVNEAMNFNKPLIVSKTTGCSEDLVVSGENGFVFETGNVKELTQRLKDILYESRLTWNQTSENIVDKYSYATVTDGLTTLL